MEHRNPCNKTTYSCTFIKHVYLLTVLLCAARRTALHISISGLVRKLEVASPQKDNVPKHSTWDEEIISFSFWIFPYLL